MVIVAKIHCYLGNNWIKLLCKIIETINEYKINGMHLGNLVVGKKQMGGSRIIKGEYHDAEDY